MTASLSPTLHPKSYQSQTLNRSVSCSKELANSNLPHLLSPKDAKGKTEFDFALGAKAGASASGLDTSTGKYLKSSKPGRHSSFLEGKTNTLQSGDKHGRHSQRWVVESKPIPNPTPMKALVVQVSKMIC